MTPKMRQAYSQYKDVSNRGKPRVQKPHREVLQSIKLDYLAETDEEAKEIYYMICFLPRMYNLYDGYGGLDRLTDIGKATWFSWMTRFDIPIERKMKARNPYENYREATNQN